MVGAVPCACPETGTLTGGVSMGYSNNQLVFGLQHKGAFILTEINQAEVMDALHECYDPEIPVNVVDLGLIYNVDINQETSHVTVTMTLTAMGCPMAGEVISEVEMRVAGVENVKSCKCELTFDPPWSADKMTEDARWELGMV